MAGSLFVEAAVAVRRCTYAKDGLMDGAPYTGIGVKVLSCVKTKAGWRLASVVWQDAEDALREGADFLL